MIEAIGGGLGAAMTGLSAAKAKKDGGDRGMFVADGSSAATSDGDCGASDGGGSCDGGGGR